MEQPGVENIIIIIMILKKKKSVQNNVWEDEQWEMKREEK